MRPGHRLRWGLVAAVIMVSLAIAAFDRGGPRSDAERVQALAAIYACPECDGQSVADSNAAVASTIRDYLRVRVSEGATDAEIRDELVRSYGTEVLLTPPSDGVSILVWILPVAVVAGGSVAVYSVIRRRTPAAEATDEDQDLVADARAAADLGASRAGSTPVPPSSSAGDGT